MISKNDRQVMEKVKSMLLNILIALAVSVIMTMTIVCLRYDISPIKFWEIMFWGCCNGES